MMAASGLCLVCEPEHEWNGIPMKPTHCGGSNDRTTPGLLGGFICSCPCRYKPHQLHAMAAAKYPDEKEQAGRHYIDLMKQAGFIVPREEGDTSPLFACGYDPRASGGKREEQK
jgi:hypothetical protein